MSPTSRAFADAELLADLAAEAEESGWDGFFIWDILLGPGDSGTSVPVVDPWVALTAIALRTRRIRLGAFMTPLARRRPETGELLNPGEVAAITEYLAGLRAGAAPIDIALNGDLTGNQDPHDTISRFENAGATWWVELCSDTPDEERDRIRAGPAGRS